MRVRRLRQVRHKRHFTGFDQALIDTDENALLNALAAGVTFFAASGDTGSHDCADQGTRVNENDVDAPASFPQVIGVGGLSTQDTNGAVTESGWKGSPFTYASDPSKASYFGFNCHVLVITAPPTPGSAGSVLRPPAQLSANQSLRSPNGRFVALLQGDGDFVVFADGRPGFATRTRAAGAALAFQSDGNLVIYDSQGRPLWASATGGSGGSDQLVMQDDGNLVLYGPRGAVWATGLPSQGVLRAPGELSSGTALLSADHRFAAVMQGDGNFVVYDRGRALWASHTQAPGSVLILQTDGNLVVYDRSWRPLWSTRTSGSGGANQLAMQDDGNLVLYGARGAVWSTGTHG